MQLHLNGQPSRRGLATQKPELMIDIQHEIAKYPQYDAETCPEGVIDIASSTNGLMNDFLSDYCDTHFQFSAGNALPYSATAGSPALTKAVASFMNDYFHPSAPISASQIIVTNGVSALLDILPFTLADEGEGIMYTTPIYGMFNHDISIRNGIKIVKVPTEIMADQFLSDNATTLVQVFEEAYIQSLKKGVRVRAIIICNPCNPTGRCYSRTSLVEIARFCNKYKLHLISDEIYAMSAFPSTNDSKVGVDSISLDAFTSVLTLDKSDGANVESIHILYGVAKDFGMGGLRLGFLITRNDLVWKCVRKLCMFSWVTRASDIFFTKFLEDRYMLTRYLATYQSRLKESYENTTHVLTEHNIPFSKANAGMFVWVDLSSWLCNFGNDKQSSVKGIEMRLTIWLMSQGVYLEPGEAFYAMRPGHFRLVYTSDKEAVKIGVQRLVDALGRLRKSSGET